jgi:hypothetical protein
MGRSRVTLAGVVALVVASMAGAPSTGDAAAVSAPPDCNPAGVVLSQAPDGRVDACLRVGELAPGPHMISLQDLLEFGPPPRKFPPPGVKRGVKPTPPPAEPVVLLSLSPSSGGPGTIVTVRGHLTRPFHPRDSHPNLCWDGCQNGLNYDDPPVRWTSPTAFRTRIIVPAAPWIEGGPARVAPLVSGDYRVAIQCVREGRACASVTEGTATFHLRVTRPPAWCRTQSTCARLRVTPAHALPGQVVRVTGFAPLAAGETPIASFPPYQIVLTRRRTREPEVRFTGRDGVREATVGLGALDVEPAPRYADLRDVTPLAQVSDGVPQISADPANPGTVAWCAGTTIGMSGAGGATPIPSATARTTLRAMGFSFRFDPDVTCAAVAPLASSAGVPAGLAAAFDVTTAAGAPPFYLAVLVTRDNGQTWTPIPVPPGSGPAGFGGFRYTGASLQAVFGVSLKGAPTAYPEFSLSRAVTEVLSADGQSWSQAPLGCPPVGPCVTFGPYRPGNCAMNGSTQTLLRSADGGRRWTPQGFPDPVQACGEAELAALSATSGLLVDSTSAYPVLRTTDGGATWRDVALPRRGGDGDLTVLPDGSLLMSHGVQYVGRWKLLRHGGRAWCELRTPSPALQRRSQVSAPVVISGALWWLSTPPENPDAAPTVNQLPLSALSC